MTATRTRYLDRNPHPTDSLRLFCFHHAGGSAAAFSGWREALQPNVQVYPVQLPGREARISEPRFADLDELVTELDDTLSPDFDRPYAFYGHSLGALVAYHLTRRRHLRGATLPSTLLVGAYPGPLLTAPLSDVTDLTDDQLAELLVRIGGMSEIVRTYPQWAQAAIGLLRDDLRLCHGYPPATVVRLPVPLHVFTGRDDPLMSTSDAAEWAGHTESDYTLQVLPGGHFFLRDAPGELLPLISTALSPSRRRTVAS